MSRKSVIIIKHGYSETCDHNISPLIDLGDLFAATVLLEAFKDSRLTWITSAAGAELLTGNHLIDRLIIAAAPDNLPDDLLAGALNPQPHDSTCRIIINLEKQRDWCSFAATTPADIRYGYQNWYQTGLDCFYPVSARHLAKMNHPGENRPFQENLYRIIGREWVGQRYSLGYRPRSLPIYDIGLNFRNGLQNPSRLWPRDKWLELQNILEADFAVSPQPARAPTRAYLDWLASCRLIVTCDAPGLHLALALNRQTVALLGPTPPEQIYMYGNGIKVTPLCDRPCQPCAQPRCDWPNPCMDHIPVSAVTEAVSLLLNTQPKTAPDIDPAITNP